MPRLAPLAIFLLAIAIVFVSFVPVGVALAEASYEAYTSMRGAGTSPTAAALVPLLGVDVMAFLLAFIVSFAGAVRFPSGLTHVIFVIFLPLTLATMQVRFFELAGDVGGWADSFGTYNFIAMFVISIVAVQLGVHFGRRRFEARHNHVGGCHAPQL